MSPGKKGVLRSSENVNKTDSNENNARVGHKSVKYRSGGPMYHRHHPSAHQYHPHHQHYHQRFHPHHHHHHQIHPLPLPPPVSTSSQQPRAQTVSLYQPLESSPKATETTSPTQQKQPKPPRSAFICFKDSKLQEITTKHAIARNHKKVLEICSAEWNKLSSKDRAAWEEEARNDKLRFVREKAAYKGTWNIPKRRAKKHPGAPKRPMSAFLAFSQSRRPQVKEDNPNMANTDVSRLLGEIWRNCTPEEKEPFVQQELKERAIYKEKIQKFREKQAAEDATKRSSHQSAVQGYHLNQHQLHQPVPQKSYGAIERPASSSPENIAVDPFLENGEPSNESSAFRPHIPAQYHRSVYLQPDLYLQDPQATWSALSMDDSDPLPLSSQRLPPHFQSHAPTEELNPSNAFYSARGNNYFTDPFDLSRYPRYP